MKFQAVAVTLTVVLIVGALARPQEVAKYRARRQYSNRFFSTWENCAQSCCGGTCTRNCCYDGLWQCNGGCPCGQPSIGSCPCGQVQVGSCYGGSQCGGGATCVQNVCCATSQPGVYQCPNGRIAVSQCMTGGSCPTGSGCNRSNNMCCPYY